MTPPSLFLSSRFHKGLRHGSDNLSGQDRYRRMRRWLLAILFLIAMTPVVITAALNYLQYQELLREEAENNARWGMESAKRNLETFLEKLNLSISLIADAYPHRELLVQENIDLAFTRLKRDHKGVVDLSVIGPNGIQKSYAGPFNLLGKDYRESPWYNNTLSRGAYISEAFLGFRNIPHFVVAVSRKMPDGGGNWVLRASVDTETLDKFLASLHSEIVTDVFLVDESGTRQSTANFRKQKRDQIVLPELSLKKGVILTNEFRSEKQVIRTYTPIRDTPWILVQEHVSHQSKNSWIQFRRQTLILLLSCAVLTTALVYWIAGFVTATIRKTEKEREAMLAQAEHTNKLASIGRLAAGVAHEINNPLAIVSAKAQLAIDLLQRSSEFESREKILASLAGLQKAVARSRDITHRLLGFARRMEVKLQPVQVNDVIEEVLSFIGQEASYHHIAIDKELDLDLPSIMSDQGQLQQILLNIINNAIDAAGKGGKVWIATAMIQPKTVRIEITDNGPGMTAEVQKKIFEPFFTTKTGKDKQGTGLGLAISYGLVKKLGGEIEVHSEVATGTTFALSFPV